MKKTLLMVLILGLFQGKAQDTNNDGPLKINGFGRIKLGMSVRDIPELSEKKDIRTAREYNNSVYTNKEPITYELFADTTSEATFFYGSFFKEVRVFQLGEYKINDKIRLHQVELSFYKDKLYEIKIEGDGVDELLTLKYGKPEMEHEEIPHTFVNGLGVEIVKIERKYTHTYNSNTPGVTCFYYFHSNYTTSGEINITQSTMLYDEATLEIVLDIRNKVEQRIKQRAEQAKKKDIENF